MSGRSKTAERKRHQRRGAQESRVVHELRVRTAAGAVWEVGVRRIIGPHLANRLAVALRRFLADAEPEFSVATRWAFAVREAIEADGEAVAGCVVELARGRVGAAESRWLRIAELPVAPDPARGFIARYADVFPGGDFAFEPAVGAENAYSPLAGRLAVTVRRALAVYRVSEFPADGGRGFRLEKVLGGTDPDERSYSIHCAADGAASCECKGYVRWERCKHAGAIAACLVNGWL